MTTTLLGLDLGTSSFKVSAYLDTGDHIATMSCPTPWRKTPFGSELDPIEFANSICLLIEKCSAAFAEGSILAIGVTGMAETMFVESAGGHLLPARAWNTPRSQQPQLPDGMLACTGLLDASRTPATELRRITDSGTVVRSWSGLPDYAVQVLGGHAVAERSLAARTGLVDICTGDWSPTLLAWAGVEDAIRPPLQPAGRKSGTVALPGRCAGAVLTVAGHDHVVASLGAGAGVHSKVFNSLGTGEALIALFPETPDALDAADVARFNAAGFNVGLGLEDGSVIAFGGLGTGNRFNLLLAALADSGFAREEVLSIQALQSSETQGEARQLKPAAAEFLGVLFGPHWQDLQTRGAATSIVRDIVQNLADARTLWWAAVKVATQNTRSALDALSSLVPSAASLVAAGGWLANSGIRLVREQILGPFDVPAAGQCGTRGAALLAGLAAGLYSTQADFPISATSIGATQ